MEYKYILDASSVFGFSLAIASWFLTFYAVLLTWKIFKKQAGLQEGIEQIEKEKLKYSINQDKTKLAIEILETFILAREGINSVRSVFGWSSETEAVEAKIKELKEKNKKAYFDEPNIQGTIFQLRFQSKDEVFSKLYTLRLKAHILLGENIESLFKEMQHIIHTLAGYINTFLRLNEGMRDYTEWQNKIFQSYPEDKDSITQKMDEIINKLEIELIPFIRRNT